MHEVAPGEFLLGYLNEHGQYCRSPLVVAGDDPAQVLPERDEGLRCDCCARRPGGDGRPRLGPQRQLPGGAHPGPGRRRPSGGSRIGQPRARRRAQTPLRARPSAARLMGRWPSGAPLTRSPEADRPESPTTTTSGTTPRTATDSGARSARMCGMPTPRRAASETGDGCVDRRGQAAPPVRRGRPYGPPVAPERALAEGPDIGAVVVCTSSRCVPTSRGSSSSSRTPG